MDTADTTTEASDAHRRLKKLMLRAYMLDEDSREAMFVLMEQIVTMLEKEHGCALAFADLAGDGVLSVIALGNKDLVGPLLQAAGDFNMSMKHTGPLQ